MCEVWDQLDCQFWFFDDDAQPPRWRLKPEYLTFFNDRQLRNGPTDPDDTRVLDHVERPGDGVELLTNTARVLYPAQG